MIRAIQTTLTPIAQLQACSLDEANELLGAWGHRMGALNRPNFGDRAYVLMQESTPLAVATASTIIRTHVGGGLDFLTRENTIELSRLCAARPGLCRVMLRLWRELVFPALAYEYAISYQDADVHNGHTYRFDGWVRLGYSRSGGTDQRSQRAGRNKWIWGWPADLLRARA